MGASWGPGSPAIHGSAIQSQEVLNSLAEAFQEASSELATKKKTRLTLPKRMDKNGFGVYSSKSGRMMGPHP